MKKDNVMINYISKKLVIFTFISKNSQSDLSPYPTGNPTPDRGKETVTPVDDTDVLMAIDGSEDFFCHLFRA